MPSTSTPSLGGEAGDRARASRCGDRRASRSPRRAGRRRPRSPSHPRSARRLPPSAPAPSATLAIRSRLLAPQLGQRRGFSSSPGEAGGQGDEGELVDRQRHLGAADLDPRSSEPRDADRPIGSPPRSPSGSTSISRPHPLEDRQQPGPGRVEANATSGRLAAGTISAATSKKAAEEKSAGTTIAAWLPGAAGRRETLARCA